MGLYIQLYTHRYINLGYIQYGLTKDSGEVFMRLKQLKPRTLRGVKRPLKIM